MQLQKNYFIALTSLCVSLSCFAQEAERGFSASIETTVAKDDNIFKTTKDYSLSDTYLSINPEVTFLTGLGKHSLRATYEGGYAKFSDYSSADYNDHNLEANLNLSHSAKFNSRIEAGYTRGHEAAGSTNRIQLDINEYNLFKSNFVKGSVFYGSVDAIGRFELSAETSSREFLNNDIQFRNFDANTYSGKFLYRIAPKTRAYIETIYTETDYTPPEGFIERDGDALSYSGGLSWEFANKLTGNVAIGYTKRQYDQELFSDVTGVTYRGNIKWAYSQYTTVTFGAKRETLDSANEADTGGFIRNNYSLGYDNQITNLLGLSTSLFYEKDTFGSSGRLDERYGAGVELDYSLKSYISIVFAYNYRERDSNIDEADFESNILKLSLVMYTGK